jgi:hypothetical protein
LRRRALVATYVVAGVLGYVLGACGIFPPRGSTSTPLARVGFALRDQSTEGSPDDWATLRDDVETVRRGWKSPDRDVLDLVVALRGLASGGRPEWDRAEGLCRALRWARCDRAALAELQNRSRP